MHGEPCHKKIEVWPITVDWEVLSVKINLSVAIAKKIKHAKNLTLNAHYLCA